MEKIVFAADHGGFSLKEKLKKYLQDKGYVINDVGTYSEESCDYPIFAFRAAVEVAQKKSDKGIIICKSGIGNSIVANKVPGIRASLCCNLDAAKATRMHNDSNVLVLGSSFVDEEQAKKIADVWLNTEFEGGRHIKRIELINKIEDNIRKGIWTI